MDINDQASDAEQVFLKSALSHRKAALTPKGTCHWCDEPIQATANFCDTDCRHDYEAHQQRVNSA